MAFYDFYSTMHEAYNGLKIRRFDHHGYQCMHCGAKLETTYLESRLYAVRCPDCHTITLIEARNPIMAEHAVGAKNEWISVKDRLPDKDGAYLVLDEDGEVFATNFDSCIDDPSERFGNWSEQYDNATWGWTGSEWFPNDRITHWMPLPEPPEDVER